MPNDPYICIKGMGSYLPEQVVTNDDLAKIVDTSDEWIRTRTGIAQRHLAAENEVCSDLAMKAAQRALEAAQLAPTDIDVLIVATVTSDRIFPSTATHLQAKLGMNAIMAFDISAACSGFLYTLEIAKNLLCHAPYQRALVIGSEKLSSIVNWTDRTTCVLFGDGAGAFVLEKLDHPVLPWIMDNWMGADGTCSDLLYMPAGGSALPATHETVEAHQHSIIMNGRELFKLAVRWMAKAVNVLLERNQLTKEDIACFIPHQANLRIIQSLAQLLDVPMERVFCNLDQTGNTSAASIPIAFAQAQKEGRFKSGDYVILVAFGGGLTFGATLIKFP